jgi:hypothetical protein
MQIWTKERVQELLKVSDKAVARAILALYSRQTASEQAGEQTDVENGVGFNKIDAPFLSSIAKALPRYNNHMTERQLRTARKMLPKYWRQLCEIANEREAQKEPSVDPVIAAQKIQEAPARQFGRFS